MPLFLKKPARHLRRDGGSDGRGDGGQLVEGKLDVTQKQNDVVGFSMTSQTAIGAISQPAFFMATTRAIKSL